MSDQVLEFLYNQIVGALGVTYEPCALCLKYCVLFLRQNLIWIIIIVILIFSGEHKEIPKEE